MDTTETFIKMRRKAIPYLGLGRPVDNPCSGMGHNIKVDTRGNWYYGKGYELFQLERQDQLQEMMAVDYKELLFCLDVFIDTIDSTRIYDYITSREQLELALVMKERYSRRWNGEDWVKN